MEPYLTKEDVIRDVALNNAITDAIIVAPLERAFEDALRDVVSLALSLYHRLGRVGVDQESEMLGVTLADIITQARSSGAYKRLSLRADIVRAIVDVSTMTSR